MDYLPDVAVGSGSGPRGSACVSLRRYATDSRHDRVKLGFGAGALVTGPDATASIQLADTLEHLVYKCPQHEIVPSVAPATDALRGGCGGRLDRRGHMQTTVRLMDDADDGSTAAI
jgi:hypothetical protein